MACLTRTVLPAVLLAMSPMVLPAAHGLAAQIDTAKAAGAETAAVDSITAADLLRHVGVLAHDSMRGRDASHDTSRDTSRGGLERTARYVAAQFQALGLEPAGDSGTWLQRYAPPRRAGVDDSSSMLIFAGRPQRRSRPVVDDLGRPIMDLRVITFRHVIVATDTILDLGAPGARGGGQGTSRGFGEFVGPNPVLVAGPHTPASLRQADLRDKVVVYVPPPGLDSATERQMIERLRAANHVIVVADEDSAAFAARRTRTRPAVVLEPYLPEAQSLRRWAVYVWAPVIADALVRGGVELAEVKATPTPLVREMGGLALLAPRLAPPAAGLPLLNTVGLLRGSGDQVVVITAHLGCGACQGGATDRGAGAADDAGSGEVSGEVSGMAELLTLAKAAAAFKRAGGSLRRSLVFAAVSGGPGEYWGSHTLIERWSRIGGQSFVLDLHLGGLGGGPRDTLVIDGLQDVALALPPAWLVVQQPELRLQVADGGSVVAAEADHLAFVQQAIPSLYLHSGEPGVKVEGAKAASALTALAFDAEQAARALRFVFTLTREVADAPTAPRWTTEGRRRRAQVFGR